MTEENYNDQILRETLWNSKALSSDVTAAIESCISKVVHDPENVASFPTDWHLQNIQEAGER